MKFLNKLTKIEKKFQRYIGLNFKQFYLLEKIITPVWKTSENERLSNKDRKRKIGGGRVYELTIREMIMTVLIYYKLYITQELLGDLVGLDQANISRLLKKMLPLIEQAADETLKNYLTAAKETCKKIATVHELYEKFPELRDVSTDATEQPCFRSKNYEEQKKYYSGKSKQHAAKVQISVSVNGRILDVSKSYAGSMHDKKIIDEEKTIEKFDPRIPHRFDSAYQGIRTTNPMHYIITPFKKPKKKELTLLEKELNRANSKRRVIVEHAIAKIKKFKICRETFRQPLQMHNQVFRNVVALLNFRHGNLNYAM